MEGIVPSKVALPPPAALAASNTPPTTLAPSTVTTTTVNSSSTTTTTSAGASSTTTTAPPSDTNADRTLFGLDLGAGFGLIIDSGSRDRVEDAEIVGGKVRVKKTQNVIPRGVLETHYFFDACTWPGGNYDGFLAVGPFAGFGMGGSDVVDVFGGGIMIGLGRRPPSASPLVRTLGGLCTTRDFTNGRHGDVLDPDHKRTPAPPETAQAPAKQGKGDTTISFNVGIGFSVDPDVKVLGDGFVANEKPPLDGTGKRETQVRFESTSQAGPMLIFSAGW